MSGPSTARLLALRAFAGAGHLARRVGLLLCLVIACRERVPVPLALTDGPAHGGEAAAGEEGAPNPTLPAGGRPAEEGAGAAGTPTTPEPAQPATVVCDERPARTECSIRGDSRQGLRLIGTLLAPATTLERGVLDLDSNGDIRCVACDCGDAGDALVIDCPDLVITPGLLNLHDHLGYSGTPPLAHPGELYEHRSEWRLGKNGHAALPFKGSASTAQVLAHELRMVMSGATSIVGAGGRRGLLRNLDVAGLSEGLLPGVIRAETFPLDDASGASPDGACKFGKFPDTAAISESVRAYVAHIGEGTNELSRRELGCALGQLDLLRDNSAVVHAMALSRDDATSLARRGASVVWSPRSNLDLYGRTAPVGLLSSLGVRVALGTDWLASGSMNVLRELACARSYDDAVLGGYFDATALWRMVTSNAAWALSLEGRLGELRIGLVGDVAVFSARAGVASASVVAASNADVRLVLRKGSPLYGDDELVSAFQGGAECEPLAVCGGARRACVAETGQNLAEILQAGEAVYPLFSCGDPPAEPGCVSIATRECPAGESDCPLPDAEPPWLERDSDADGVPDFADVCARVADPEQADADADGQGDACDACPATNPGLTPCPVSIASLRGPRTRLALGTAVLLQGVRVTALREQGAKGYYVEDGDHAPYSGIFVYTETKPRVSRGDLVTVQGYLGSFQGADQLVAPELLDVRAATESYAPLSVAVTDVADGSHRAAELAGLFVHISELEVVSTNPDAPNDYDETGLAGGLRLDDLLHTELDNQFVVGTRFSSVQAIVGKSFSHQKLWPTSADDVLLERGGD